MQQLMHEGSQLEDGAWPDPPVDVQLVLVPVSALRGKQHVEAVCELTSYAAVHNDVKVARLLLETAVSSSGNKKARLEPPPALPPARPSQRELRRLRRLHNDKFKFSWPDLHQALLGACEHGHLEIMRLLLEYVDGSRCAAVLDCALARRHAQIVRLLSGAGCKDGYGNTALIRASTEDQVETVAVLLEAGTDLDERNSYGNTALIRASNNNRIESARLLLRAGADKDSSNISGRTALICAAAKGHLDIACLLVEAGADKDMRDASGQTALLHASNNGHDEIVRLLAPGEDLT